MIVKTVIKRDGSLVDFDINKIRLAILSAMYSENIFDYEYVERAMDEIVEIMEDDINDIALSVESIQDIVVEVLESGDYTNVGQTYSEYRRVKEKNRSNATSVDDNISKFLNKDKEVVNENANKDSDTFNTQRDLMAGSLSKPIGLKSMLPIKIANSHLKGQIHWHEKLCL